MAQRNISSVSGRGGGKKGGGQNKFSGLSSQYRKKSPEPVSELQGVQIRSQSSVTPAIARSTRSSEVNPAIVLLHNAFAKLAPKDQIKLRGQAVSKGFSNFSMLTQ